VDSTEARLAVDAIESGTPSRRDAERSISHFIPSTRLEGSREDKIRELDFLIAHLQDLRLGLAGNFIYEKRAVPAWRVESKWPWVGAGAVMGAVSAWLILSRFL